jgi:hypothetical protein
MLRPVKLPVPSRFPLRALCVAVAVAGLAVPTAAFADKADTILKDWRADKRIDGTYQLADLRTAQTRAQSDELEYSSLKPELDRAIAEASSRESGDHRSNLQWVLLFGVAVLLVVGAVVLRSKNDDRPSTDRKS